jgi:hypothetical protein
MTHSGRFVLFICAASPTPPLAAQAATVRDSAGVQIVENHDAIWTTKEALHLATSPSLVIGNRTAEEYQLNRVAGAARLADRRIVIGDGESLQLRFYDASGQFLSSAGRKGDGPGEFRFMRQVDVSAGDTITAGTEERVSRFNGSGKFVRTIDPLNPPAQIGIGERMIIAAFAGGATMMGTIPHPMESNHRPLTGLRWTDSVRLTLVGDGNAVLRPLGRYPVRVLEWQGLDLMPPWFSPQALFSNTAQRGFLGFGSEYSIRVYSSTGRLERIIRRAWVPKRVDINGWAAQYVNGVEGLSSAEVSAKQKEMRDSPHATTLPAFQQLIADRADRLWVRESRLADFLPQASAPAVPTLWSVFSKDGKWLGDVSMPPRFLATDIGSDYVLGVARDVDGVETVVMYRLSASGS